MWHSVGGMASHHSPWNMKSIIANLVTSWFLIFFEFYHCIWIKGYIHLCWIMICVFYFSPFKAFIKNLLKKFQNVMKIFSKEKNMKHQRGGSLPLPPSNDHISRSLWKIKAIRASTIYQYKNSSFFFSFMKMNSIIPSHKLNEIEQQQ